MTPTPTPVELPALDGRDPLGFLAALGLLHLLTTGGANPRLAFSDSTANAVLHSPLASVAEIVDTLTTIVAAIPPDAVISEAPAGFPLHPAGRTRAPRAAKTDRDEKDPMRVPRERFRDRLLDRVAALGTEAAHWVPVLVTDLAVDNQGRAALTPYMAPSGQQKVRTFFAKPLDAVRDDPHRRLTEALTGWRRLDGFTGEYLDHRVLRSAADHPRGDPSQPAGVPGATWLATHALPLLRLTGDGETPAATLWHRIGRRALMVWPLWTPPLDPLAVRVLLEHPALRPSPHPEGGRPGEPVVSRARLAPLGVFAINAAERRLVEGGKSAGVLTPTRIATRD